MSEKPRPYKDGDSAYQIGSAWYLGSQQITEGSVWQADCGLAKVVGINASTSGIPHLVAEVVYDSGEGFRPSIMPSTWFLGDWGRKFKPTYRPELELTPADLDVLADIPDIGPDPVEAGAEAIERYAEELGVEDA